jgi:hypothetical protein
MAARGYVSHFQGHSRIDPQNRPHGDGLLLSWGTLGRVPEAARKPGSGR